MKLKMLALAAATTLAAISAPTAMACSVAAWTGGATGSPVAGQPNDSTPTRRYSGLCGLRAPSSGSYVVDNSPSAEPVFRARFYVYTGVTGGDAVVFQALDSSSSPLPMITVTYSATANNFTFTTTGGSGTVGSITANRWYSIELAWAAADATVPSGMTAGTMTASVQGAGAASATSATGSMTTGNGDDIETVRLGWVSGSATGGAVTTDAYESRRATAIGRLCRGNANTTSTGSGGAQTRNIFDVTRIISEINGTLAGDANSTPDCTEDGNVNIFDVTCVISFINSTAVCP